MTITTKENANGRISAYYVDGVKVRKNEIDGIINNRRDEIIYVDYYTGQEFKMLTRSFNRQLKVVFTGYSETIMTQAAADELGYNVIRKWTGTYSNTCLVEKKNEEIIAKNHEGAKVTVESARANGLTFEEFMAANAGLSVEEYRAKKETERIENARKEEENATAYALQSKIDSLKFDIRFYDEKSRRATWHLYKAVIENDKDNAEFIARDIAEFENIIAETKSQLAELEPVKEVIAETDGSEDDPDDNNDVFNYLPSIESLNDVDTTQSVDEMKAAADKMGLMQLNRKIAYLEEQLIDNRRADVAILCDLSDGITEFERRHAERAAIRNAIIDEKAIYYAAKSTRLTQIAAIKNLMSKSETATVEEVKTDAELQDEFTAELAKLETEKTIAKEKEENAKVIYKIASDNYEERRAALQNFLDKHATRLNEKIATDIPCKCLKVITQKGEQYTVDFTTDMHVDAFNGFGKRFIIQYYHGIYFAHYDTPAQVQTVIDMLKAAIERGDNEFTFPTVDELNDTAKSEPDNSASTIDDLKTKRDRLYRHKALLTKAEFEHMEEKLTADIAQLAESQKTAEETQLDKLTVAEKNVADETVEPETTENAVKEICERVRNVRKRGINHVVTSKGRHMWYEHGSLTSKDIIAIILAKEGFTIEEYIAAEKTAEDYWWNVELPRMVVISNQATFLEDKHWREVKTYDEELTANVMPPEIDDSEDELIDPPDKADIHDSLSRAMKIALLKVQDFCREKNLKAAQNELSLYNICANAMRQEVTI